MNRFANIKETIRFNKVVYYTIVFEEEEEEEEESLLQKFSNRFSDIKYEDALNLIRSWLSRLGEEIGAKPEYFRHERGAHAFPPPAKYINVYCDLRLYCLRINDSAVVLFDGCEKTAGTAQECDNCRPVFTQANRITAQIDEKIRHKEIRINPENDEVEFDDDLILEI